VQVIVEWIVVVVNEIPSPSIVNITIGIIIKAIVCDFARIGPPVICQVSVGKIDSCIHGGKRNRVLLCEFIPGLYSLDFFQPPLICNLFYMIRSCNLKDIVWFHELQPGPVTEFIKRLLDS